MLEIWEYAFISYGLVEVALTLVYSSSSLVILVPDVYYPITGNIRLKLLGLLSGTLTQSGATKNLEYFMTCANHRINTMEVYSWSLSATINTKELHSCTERPEHLLKAQTSL